MSLGAMPIIASYSFQCEKCGSSFLVEDSRRFKLPLFLSFLIKNQCSNCQSRNITYILDNNCVKCGSKLVFSKGARVGVFSFEATTSNLGSKTIFELTQYCAKCNI